jgi:hypothetical protein
MSVFSDILESVLSGDVIEEKVIRVAHLTQKEKSKARKWRLKNKSKLKKIRKKFKLRIKNKKKKKGWSYGADGKLRKIVQRRGVRRHH